MLRALIPLTILIVATAAAAAPPTPTELRAPKPPDPGWAPARVVFDCTGRDTLSIAPGFTATITDSTVGAATDFDAYPCTKWQEEGPEHVYRLEVTERTILTATLTEAEDEDLDLYLLNDCDTDSCLAGANIEFTADLAPGTYFLVVETYGAGTVPGLPYILDLEARWPGVPPQPCDPGGATVVVCDVSTLTGDLFGKPDLVRTYDCNPGISTGGEDWYEITSPALRVMKLEVRTLVVGLDPVIWIFDGCGPDAVCLDFIDATLAFTGEGDGSGIEVLDWRQESEQPATVWVAVDSALPPAAAGTGAYEIIIDCQTVPTEQTSFGSLRALYR